MVHPDTGKPNDLTRDGVDQLANTFTFLSTTPGSTGNVIVFIPEAYRVRQPASPRVISGARGVTGSSYSISATGDLTIASDLRVDPNYVLASSPEARSRRPQASTGVPAWCD